MFSPEPMQWLGLLGSCRVGCISREGSGSLSEKSGRDKVEPTLLAAASPFLSLSPFIPSPFFGVVCMNNILSIFSPSDF